MASAQAVTGDDDAGSLATAFAPPVRVSSETARDVVSALDRGQAAVHFAGAVYHRSHQLITGELVAGRELQLAGPPQW